MSDTRKVCHLNIIHVIILILQPLEKLAQQALRSSLTSMHYEKLSEPQRPVHHHHKRDTPFQRTDLT